jgi:hypothetical protein
MRLFESRRADLRILVGGPEPRIGLKPDHVRVELLPAGAVAWREKALTPSSFRDLGRGVYALAFDPDEVGGPGVLAFVVSGRDGLDPPLAPMLHSYEVAPATSAADRITIRTTLTGRVVTIDDKPIPQSKVIVRPIQPFTICGTFVSIQAVNIDCDADGRFEFDALAGATLNVQIPVVGVNKNIVVPPPPAPGLPIALSSL